MASSLFGPISARPRFDLGHGCLRAWGRGCPQGELEEMVVRVRVRVRARRGSGSSTCRRRRCSRPATSSPAPTNVRVHGHELSWDATADLESGLAHFIIERDGKFLVNVPEQGKNPFGRPIFQNLQYSDTPTQPLVPMQFTDVNAQAGTSYKYRVIAVNTVGLTSEIVSK